MTGLPSTGYLFGIGMACAGALAAGSLCTACEAKGQSRETPTPHPQPSSSASEPKQAVRGRAHSCPQGMLPVGFKGQESFCVDRYEANLVEAETGAALAASQRPAQDVRYRAVSVGGVLPQAYVNRLEASAACEASGKRLCKAREWYAACSGSQHAKYPYGNKFEAKRCNVDKGHLLHKLFGNVTYTYDAHYNNPKLNLEPGFLAKTGEYAECTSESGANDMMGNLHEWVADDVSAKLRQELPLEKGDQWLGKRGMGVFMGGYFSSHGEHGTGCLYVTATHAPDYHDYSTGFRCCADPQG